MINMIFSIEDRIFEDLIRCMVLRSSDIDSIKRTIDTIEKHISQKPRKQIRGFNEPIGYLFALYMDAKGYTYDSLAYS